MNGLVVLAVIALANAAASAATGNEDVIHACAEDDQECFKSAIQRFFTVTAGGFPKYEIKPYDPLTVEDVKVEWNGQYLEFKNAKITGYKDQVVTFSEVSKDTDHFKSKADVLIEADAFIKGEKEYTDKYTIKATVEGGASYPREVKKGADGKEYIFLGDATITCDVESVPEVTFGPKLTEAFTTDAIIVAQKKEAEDHILEIRKKIACAFVHEAYEAITSSLRQFLAAVPKDELYKQ